jgi:hypothetical protein
MADQNPVAGGSGTGCVVQNQNIVIDLAAQNAAAQLAQQILANTNVMLKQEIVKIPEYFGKNLRTPAPLRNSSPELMNVKSQTTGTTPQPPLSLRRSRRMAFFYGLSP